MSDYSDPPYQQQTDLRATTHNRRPSKERCCGQKPTASAVSGAFWTTVSIDSVSRKYCENVFLRQQNHFGHSIEEATAPNKQFVRTEQWTCTKATLSQQ
jgi:hypothetical protein